MCSLDTSIIAMSRSSPPAHYSRRTAIAMPQRPARVCTDAEEAEAHDRHSGDGGTSCAGGRPGPGSRGAPPEASACGGAWLQWLIP
jgi:hypothetical protein